jgi:hypothetical protein
MYDRGIGMEQDLAEAFKWFNRAANQGFPTSQHTLGCWFAAGRGDLFNSIEASKWLLLAEANGFEGANLARRKVQFGMTQEQIDESIRRAKAFKPVQESSAGF